MNQDPTAIHDPRRTARIPRPIHVVLILIGVLVTTLIADFIGLVTFYTFVELNILFAEQYLELTTLIDPVGTLDPVFFQISAIIRIFFGFVFIISLIFVIVRRYEFNVDDTLHLNPYFKFRPYVFGVLATLAIGFLTIRMIGEISPYLMTIYTSNEFLLAPQSIQPTNLPVYIAFLLALSLGPGIYEELIFRGFVLRSLCSQYGSTIAVVSSGLLFALFHLNPVNMLVALPIGLWLGYMVVRTGSLYLAIAGHGAYNFTLLLQGAIWHNTQPELASHEIFLGLMYPPLVVGLVLLVAIGGVVEFYRLTAMGNASEKSRTAP